jgi:hypothetical protein
MLRMSAAAFAALILSATAGVHIDEVGELGPELRRALVAEVTAALEERSGLRAVVDEAKGSCVEANCIAAMRSRTASLELVLLKVIRGPLSLHVVADRVPEGAPVPGARAETDLDREPLHWREKIAILIATLYPPKPAERGVLRVAEIEPARSIVPPLVLFTGSAILLGVGLVFGAKSQATIDDLGARVHPPAELHDLSSRAGTEATIANLLFVLAGSAAIGGLFAVIDP